MVFSRPPGGLSKLRELPIATSNLVPCFPQLGGIQHPLNESQRPHSAEASKASSAPAMRTSGLFESGLGVHTHLVDNNLEIEGEAGNVSRAENILEDYNTLLREGHVFNNGDLNSYLRVVTDRSRSLAARAGATAASSAISARRSWRRRPSTSAATSKPSSATTWSSASAPPAPARPTSPSPWRSPR